MSPGALLVRTLLIIDDDPSILSALRRALRREPYRTITGQSYTEGKRLLKSVSPDVLLTDYRMPNNDGLHLAEFAKKLDPTIVCVMLTGCSDE